MKNKALALTLAFVIAFLLPVGVFAVLDAVTPAQYSESFLAGLGLKYDLIKQASSPKIVLIGGSSAAFGVDSDLLEEQLPGYDVVNFGLYATLGTSTLLCNEGIRVNALFRISKGRPNLLDLIHEGEIQWVINTSENGEN